MWHNSERIINMWFGGNRQQRSHEHWDNVMIYISKEAVGGCFGSRVKTNTVHNGT
jgi:hypothetical protein